MSQLPGLEYSGNVHKEIIAQQLADTYGLNIEKVYDNYWDNKANKAPEIYYNALDDDSLKYFVPEECGFKSNIDELDRWTDEEALRHLIRNILCFK